MRHAKLAAFLAAGLAGFSLLFAVPAMAEAPSPQWTVTAVSHPTDFAPASGAEGEDAYKVLVTNTGARANEEHGETIPITITDELPAGLSLAPAGASGEDTLERAKQGHPTADFNCVLRTCTYSGALPPSDTLILTFPVVVSAGPFADSCEVPAEALGCLTNVIRVSGGGAPTAQVSTPTPISEHAAGFGISPGGATSALSTDQAGAHPDLTNSIAFNTTDAQGSLAGDPKDVSFDLPPGFAGDLIDTPVCTSATFSALRCPTATQVGIATVVPVGAQDTPLLEPVYNLSPNPGQVAKLGFLGYEGGVTLRPGDYGLRTVFPNAEASFVELQNVSLTIWGVPADPVHDPMRLRASKSLIEGGGPTEWGVPSEAAPAPYFTNPTSCGEEPLTSSFRIDSWQQPDAFVTTSMHFGPIVGCDRLTMEPSIETQPSTDTAETPTGLDVHMKIPQTYDNPFGLATPNLRDAKVTLPEGMSLNPSAGSGLGYCTLAEFDYEAGTAEPNHALGCPNEAKVGTVHIKSPSVAEEASGSLFVAKPFENRFDSLLALYIVARIPDRGIVVTAAGKVSPDPVTGQLTTTFDENPQVPFSDFTLAFHQGATSPLVTPPVCGDFTAASILDPWSVPSQEYPLSSSFEITHGIGGGPCPSGATPPFHPGLNAGTTNNRAGSYSPFYIRLSRQDGEQEITHFSIKLPPGVIGKLAGIPLCSDAQIAKALSRSHEGMAAQEEADPSCPAGSEVGRTIVEAGVGTVLAQAPGKIYLAGPYHGSSLSVVSITDAHVGPFDLGTVVVREALKVNPETAEVFVDATGSDPLPHIIDGIPTHLRNVRIYMDRPEFVLNPTSCEPTSTASTVLGSGLNFASEADDVPVTVTSPFQAADCAALPFAPRLSLKLLGATKRTAHPALKATLRMNGIGEASISKAQVTLPKSEFLENAHIRTVCTRVQFKEGAGNGAACPPGSVYGFARAKTPILSEPLEGPVYLRSSEHNLPDLVAALHGSEINVDLVGRIDSLHGQIRNTFESVPDAPVESFTLEMQGGGKGLLVNSENLCGRPHRAIVDFTAHNGKVSDTTPAVGAKCPKPHRHKGKHGHKRAHRHR